MDVLKGLGNLANMGNMLKQVMEMKSKMEELKESLGTERVTAASGGGMVTIEMTGKMEVLSVKIEPDVIDKAEPEVLETLVRAAVNEAIGKAQMLVKEKMTEATGGLDIPGLT